jgi:hypothetical protein
MSQFFIKFPGLIIGIIVGFIVLRLFAIDRPIFYKWPSPENVGNITYKDKNGTCYQYEGNIVDCSQNKKKIKPVPLQVPQPYAIMK